MVINILTGFTVGKIVYKDAKKDKTSPDSVISCMCTFGKDEECSLVVGFTNGKVFGSRISDLLQPLSNDTVINLAL